MSEAQDANLHDDIHEPSLPLLLTREAYHSYSLVGTTKLAQKTSLTVHCIDIFFQHRSIPFPLHFRKPDIDIDFLL
jgi:hypothetical protein